MDFGQRDKKQDWHARWQGRLWLAVSVPIWLIGLALPLFRWEGPPPNNLVFRECHVPEMSPLASRPSPPASYCEARRDAAAEYAKLKWQHLNIFQAIEAGAQDIRRALGEPDDEVEVYTTDTPTQTEADIVNMPAHKQRRIQQTFRQYRQDLVIKYQVAECHLDNSCELETFGTPASDIYGAENSRDIFWREPCSAAEKTDQSLRHSNALARCETVKSDTQRRSAAVSSLNNDRFQWATALLLPTILLLILPFVIAGGAAFAWWTYKWIRRGGS